MKVAFVTHRFPQTSETFIARQARILDADIICEAPTYSLPEDYYGPFRIFYLCGPTAKVRARIGALLPDRARSFARKTISAPARLGWDKGLNAAWRKYLGRRRPDVVLAHFGPNALAALPACQQRGIPLVAHFHGYDATSMMRSEAYRQALPTLFQQAYAVVCGSSFVAGILRAAGCPEEKLHYIPIGVPLRDFVKSVTVARQPCRFLAISRLVPVKGPMVTLEAFRLIHAYRHGTHLTFIGGGPLRNEMQAFIRKHELDNAVTLKGPLHADDVRRFLLDASVFVQASLTDASGATEGWGLSLAEALATGLPAIVTRSGGMTDLVKDGYNGLLFEEGDAQAMAARMLRLADDPELRVLMGGRGRQHIEEIGSTEQNVRLLAAVLQSACSAALVR